MDHGEITYQGSYEEIKDEDYFIYLFKHYQENESDSATNDLEETKEIPQEVEFSSPSSFLRRSYLSNKGSTLSVDENKEIARVGFKVYLQYFCYSKTTVILFIITLLFQLSRKLLQVYFDYSLLQWVKHISETKENDGKLFTTIIGATIGSGVLTFIGALINIIFALNISISIF